MSRTSWTRKARNKLLPILMALAIVFGTATAITVVSAAPAHASITNTRADAWGTLELSGSSWLGGNGVNVYSNGSTVDGPSPVTWNCVSVAGATGDPNCANGQVTSGEEWQCVEMVNRLYLTQGWTTNTWSGDGYQLYGDAPSNLAKEAQGSITYLNPGDVIVLSGYTDGHAGIIDTVTKDKADSNYTVQIVNQNTIAVYSSATWNPTTGNIAMTGWSGYSVTGIVHRPSGSPPANSGGSGPSRQLIVNNNTDWAEDSIGNAWTDETHTGDASVAVGGGLMVIINNCGAVYALNSLTGVWTNETGCGDAKAVAVSANGTQMYLDYCNAVNAQSGSPSQNWTQESGCGTAQAIAIGKDGIQMMIDACNEVWAKVGVGVGGWNPETGCGTAKAIAAGADKTQVILNACNAVYAQDGISTTWNLEQNCGAAQAIAAGGWYQMLINACGEVYAVYGISTYWTPESPCNAATAIALGAQGRQLYIGGNGHTYAEDSLTLGDNWTDETPGGGTTAIAVG